jgi:hypothetical protein
MVTFNILIATIGRPSLQRMLDSLKPQLVESDCLTIVFDGTFEIPPFNLSGFVCKINQHFEPVALGAWGHGIRNKYSQLLEPRDFILHGDDDDIYLPEVFSELRKQCLNIETLYIAKINIRKIGRDIPEGSVIKINDIGTPNGIIPYSLNTVSTWAYQYGGDGIFYEELAKKAKCIEFLPTIIYLV